MANPWSFEHRTILQPARMTAPVRPYRTGSLNAPLLARRTLVAGGEYQGRTVGGAASLQVQTQISQTDQLTIGHLPPLAWASVALNDDHRNAVPRYAAQHIEAHTVLP